MKSDDIDDDQINEDQATKKRSGAGGDGRPGN
jgi:hypothetical protein